LGAISYLLVGLCLIAAGHSSSPVSAALLIAAGTGLTMFTLAAAWGTAIEIGGNHVGVVGGTMNSIGNLVAMLNPLIVAYSVDWFANWDLPLYIMGGLFLVGAACWMIIDPRRPVFGTEPEALEPRGALAPMNAR
jgi:hypothetical protein